jgi:hypothetical protein
MKIILTLIFTIAILCSCNPPMDKTNNSVDTTQSIIPSKPSKLSEAKEIAKTILTYVEQADMKKITKKQLDKKAAPLQKHLDSLRFELTPDELKELDDYRTQLVIEMADRKVAREK